MRVKEITLRFSSYTVRIQPYTERSNTRHAIEIRLDEAATLFCYFTGDEEVCDIALLFPDKRTDIHKYIGYLNRNYRYDFLRSAWQLAECYIAARGMKDAYYFMFFNNSE